MNKLPVKTAIGSALPIATPYQLATLKTAIGDALAATEGARNKCIIAGQMLNELKTRLGDNEFTPVVETHFPEISHRTATTWMRAARNFIAAIPMPKAIDIEASVIFSTPDEDLPAEAKQWKSDQLELWGKTSIREACAGVFVEGDEAHRVDRALNGSTKGGKGSKSAPDRKAFEVFTATKLGHITTFLTVTKKNATGKKSVVGWRQLSPVQQNAIGAAFTTSMEKWPQWLLDIIADKAKTESKMSDAQRIAR